LAQTGGSFESCYDCIFVVSLRAWIVNCYVNEDSFKLLYQIVFLVFISCFHSCLTVISLIYGFLRRWRICCRHAHISWFNRHLCFSFLSECNLSDLWIPEAMEDLFVMPIFHGSTDVSVSRSCLNVISLIYGFLRRWRICCHHAHLSWFNRRPMFFFLSGSL
jgi:hypothetical protein